MYRVGLAQSKPFCFDASLSGMHTICLMVRRAPKVSPSSQPDAGRPDRWKANLDGLLSRFGQPAEVRKIYSRLYSRSVLSCGRLLQVPHIDRQPGS